MNKFCSNCKTDKSIDLFRRRSKSKTGYDYICKECHAANQKNRWRAKTIEEKKILNKKYYESYRNSLVFLSLEEQIERWARFILNRKSTMGAKTSQVSKNRFVSRGDLSKEVLIAKANEGLKLFPYMSFLNFRGDGNEIKYASLDRVDSGESYSDDNIRVIPLWLNSAKLNASQKEIDCLISDYYKRFL